MGLGPVPLAIELVPEPMEGHSLRVGLGSRQWALGTTQVASTPLEPLLQGPFLLCHWELRDQLSRRPGSSPTSRVKAPDVEQPFCSA